MPSVWAELKRRNVVKVGVAYAIVGWLLVEIAATILPIFEAPVWTVQVFTLFLILGFPVALILSWAYELTPTGVERTKSVPLSESISKITGRKLDFVIIGLLVLTVGFMFYDNYVPESGPFAGAEIDPASVEPAVTPTTTEDVQDSRLPDSVAVLPLENLSPDPDDEYFAAGIHEEILNQLAKLRSLNVISRTSVLRYARDRPSIPEIARELNVEAVMEGSVRYAGDSILVTVQLIDAETDTHIWSQSYPGDLSDSAAIFSIQADIAMNVANALEAEFSAVDRDRLSHVQTDSADAYALYLRALDAWRPQGIETAIAFLDEAIQIDPEFAEAYGQRGFLYAVTLITEEVGASPSLLSYEEIEAHAIEDSERALSIDPSTGSAFRALGNLHSFAFRWSEAEEAFHRAVELSPNDTSNLGNLALFKSFIGKEAEAVFWMERHTSLSPGTVRTYEVPGRVFLNVKDSANAVTALEEGIGVFPGDGELRFFLASALIQNGNETEAEAHLRIGEQLFGDSAQSGQQLVERAYAFSRLGLEADAMRLFSEFESWASNHRAGTGTWAMAYLAIGDYDRALEWLTRTAEKADAAEGDGGYFATNAIRINRLNDPVLETARFRAIRDRLRID